MEDLQKTKIDRTEDIRHTYLRKLVKNVFGTISNSIKKDNVNSIIIIRGKGKELKDCSFTEKYYFEYVELFKYTFTRKNCTFEYQGARPNNKGYNRDTAMVNAVSFFNKHNIDLRYSFHSQAEQALFSRLIYKYISWLLEVLFEDYNCEGNERDSLVEEKYEKAFSRIKSEINTNDIIDLIYSEAKIGDIEQITDPKLDKSGFNIAYLLDTEQFQQSILRVKNDVICNINGYYSAIASNIIMNKAGMKYQIFPFKKNSRFSVEKDTHNLSIRIWQNTCKEMYCPRYFWYVTKNTEYDSREEASLNDYRLNRSKAEMIGAAMRALETRYPYNKHKNYLQWMAYLNEVLRQIYSENYNSYFSKDNAKKWGKEKGYLNLKSFLKDNTIDELDPKIIYIYLVSVAIDNLCEKLNIFNHEEMKKYISKDDKAYKQHCKYLKEICDSKNLETAINKYTAFYNDNKSVIYAFAQKVEISKISCDETLLSTEYNPYLFLKNSLQRYYKCLCNTQQEPFIYFDIGSSSIESSDDNNKGILYFENGKNYRIEFEACGCSDDPFSFIIINKKTDGTLVSVFDKSDIILTSDMQKYTFEFCYNGSDDDMCFLTFGYGTFLRGFKLQNFSIFEIQ